MTPYEKGIRALAEDLAMGDPFELYLESAERVKAFLAGVSADGPVIFVDGKVAELGAAVARAVVDTDQEGLASDWVRGLIDAAREVAQ